jgi:hypothetical protein
MFHPRREEFRNSKIANARSTEFAFGKFRDAAGFRVAATLAPLLARHAASSSLEK